MRDSRCVRSVAAVLCLAAAGRARAAYVISLNAEADATYNNYSTNQTSYGIAPNISATNNGVATPSRITFTSPGGYYKGYVNGPGGATSSGTNTSAAAVANANGTWLLNVVEGTTSYNYNVGVSLTLPFATLPSLSSADLVAGKPYTGTVGFAVAGGSADYPGPNDAFSAVLAGGSGTTYVVTQLPAGSTGWTPNQNVSAESTVSAYIYLSSGSADPTALRVTGVTPTAAGEPAVTFAPPTILYAAERNATLTVVPEPASAGAAVAGLALLCRRRYRPSADGRVPVTPRSRPSPAAAAAPSA